MGRHVYKRMMQYLFVAELKQAIIDSREAITPDYMYVQAVQ